jgi:hypothetical protein
MPRPVKWARDLNAIRERATNSRTETWSRADIEDLFGVGRATAQSLTKAIGEVQAVAGAHFVDRSNLLAFLDSMIASPMVEASLRKRLIEAPSPPHRRPLKVALPPDLRIATVCDLPANIRISSGELRISASNMEGLLESLVVLAKVLESDFEAVQTLIETPRPSVDEEALRRLVHNLRSKL